MYQQITILGNVGSDPELRYTQGGVAVTNFSVAVNKRYSTSDDEQREDTTWFRVTVWRKQAEVVAQYLKKGRQVLVIGEASVSAYTNRAGEAAASLDITAHNVKFIGSSGEREAGGQEHGNVNQNADGTPMEDIPF